MASINDDIRKYQRDNSLNVGDCYFYFENSKLHPSYSNYSISEPDETRYAVVTGKKESVLHVTIPQYVINPTNNLQYKVLEIGIEAFKRSNIETVCIKADLESINYSAFEKCKSLEKVVFGDKLTKLGSYSFSGCKNLKNVVLPRHLEKIERYCFQDCVSLTSMTIPSTVKIIGNESFSGCRNLKRVSMLSEEIELHWNAFLDCRKIKNIVVPLGKRYPAEAFTGCVNLPENFVSMLDKSAFSDRLRKEYNEKRRKKSIWYKALCILLIFVFFLVLAIGFCIFLIVYRFIMAFMAIAGTIFTILLLIYGLTDYFVKFKGDLDEVMKFITVVSTVIAVIIIIAGFLYPSSG